MKPEPIPAAAAHRELVADLTHTLNMDAGLSQIMGLDLPDSSARSASTQRSCDTSDHYALVRDLASRLHTSDGVAEILSSYGPYTHLVTDLTSAVDTTRGLAAILDSDSLAMPPTTDAIRHRSEREPGSPTTLEDAHLSGPLQGNLEVIERSLGLHRLQLRSGDRHHLLRRAVTVLDEIRLQLTKPRHGYPVEPARQQAVVDALQRQNAAWAGVVAAMARALPDDRVVEDRGIPGQSGPRTGLVTLRYAVQAFNPVLPDDLMSRIEDVLATHEATAPSGETGAGLHRARPLQVSDGPPLATAFQPRQELLACIDDARASNTDGGGGTGGPLSVVLVGMGGVGKSQLAAHYFHRAVATSSADVVLWADASTADSVIAAFANAAKDMNAAGAEGSGSNQEISARAFLDWAATTDRRWLVVLDGITDPDHVAGWWPASHVGSGWVLATTRHRDAVVAEEGLHVVMIEGFTPEEALTYLAERLTQAGLRDELLDDRALELAQAMGYLPLALSQAATYMQTYLVPCRDFLTRLISHNSDPGGGLSAYNRTLMARLVEETANRRAPSQLDHRSLAAADTVLNTSLQDLVQLQVDLRTSDEALAGHMARQAIQVVDAITGVLTTLSEMLSDLRSADLQQARLQTDPENMLDGVRWSDESSLAGPTRWPSSIRHWVQANSVPVPELGHGVYEVRFGSLIGSDR